MTLEASYDTNYLMEDPEGNLLTRPETNKTLPIGIVPLPYTEVERDISAEEVQKNIAENREGPRTTHDLSHFSARAILAAWELAQMLKSDNKNLNVEFIITGENKNPSTADLERNFLVNNRKVDPNKIKTYPDLNGTLQQLEPVAKLQREGKLGPVKILAFEFHMDRAQEIMDLLGIKGEVVEVEKTHTDYLKQQGATRVNRDELVNLPQVQEVKKTEKGPVGLIWKADKMAFGAKAPISRSLKFATGATVTDVRGHKGVRYSENNIVKGEPAEALTYFPRIKRIKKPVVASSFPKKSE